jgi:tripartite-type tricarboxylate transporter receptor subunit TctC
VTDIEMDQAALCLRTPVVISGYLNFTNAIELIALAKSKPGELNFASSGAGSSTHMSSELFKAMAGIDIVHVPYRGSAQAMNDVLSGQVTMLIDNAPSSVGFIQQGTLRPLAVTSTKRLPTLPEIPTMDESGLKGYSVMTWYVVFAPAKTPTAIIQRAHEEFDKALKVQEVQNRLRDAGITEIVNGTPDAAATFVQSEYQRWGNIIRALNLRAN